VFLFGGVDDLGEVEELVKGEAESFVDGEVDAGLARIGLGGLWVELEVDYAGLIEFKLDL